MENRLRWKRACSPEVEETPTSFAYAQESLNAAIHSTSSPKYAHAGSAILVLPGAAAVPAHTERAHTGHAYAVPARGFTTLDSRRSEEWRARRAAIQDRLKRTDSFDRSLGPRLTELGPGGVVLSSTPTISLQRAATLPVVPPVAIRPGSFTSRAASHHSVPNFAVPIPTRPSAPLGPPPEPPPRANRPTATSDPPAPEADDEVLAATSASTFAATVADPEPDFEVLTAAIPAPAATLLIDPPTPPPDEAAALAEATALEAALEAEMAAARAWQAWAAASSKSALVGSALGGSPFGMRAGSAIRTTYSRRTRSSISEKARGFGLESDLAINGGHTVIGYPVPPISLARGYSPNSGSAFHQLSADILRAILSCFGFGLIALPSPSAIAAPTAAPPDGQSTAVSAAEPDTAAGAMALAASPSSTPPPEGVKTMVSSLESIPFTRAAPVSRSDLRSDATVRNLVAAFEEALQAEPQQPMPILAGLASPTATPCKVTQQGSWTKKASTASLPLGEEKGEGESGRRVWGVNDMSMHGSQRSPILLICAVLATGISMSMPYFFSPSPPPPPECQWMWRRVGCVRCNEWTAACHFRPLNLLLSEQKVCEAS